MHWEKEKKNNHGKKRTQALRVVEMGGFVGNGQFGRHPFSWRFCTAHCRHSNLPDSLVEAEGVKGVIVVFEIEKIFFFWGLKKTEKRGPPRSLEHHVNACK